MPPDATASAHSITRRDSDVGAELHPVYHLRTRPLLNWGFYTLNLNSTEFRHGATSGLDRSTSQEHLAAAPTGYACSGLDQGSEYVFEKVELGQVRALVDDRVAAQVGEAVALVELPRGDILDVGVQADSLAVLLAGNLERRIHEGA